MNAGPWHSYRRQTSDVQTLPLQWRSCTATSPDVI